MNWLRDNILKVVLGIFLLIIIAIVIVACTMGNKTTPDISEGYAALENRLQNAAIKYVNEHPNILPKTTDTIKKVKLDTLVNAGKIGKLHSPEDKSVVCKGYVEIEKLYEDKNEYKYIPYISCGKYYVTTTIADHIIDLETKNGEFNRTSEDGLYKFNNEYVFRGEYPNNFISIAGYLYRIIKIDENKQLQLISVGKTRDKYIWDDRYNYEKDRYYGINDFEKSRLNNSLLFVYENDNEEEGEIFITEEERSYIVEHDFCIGKRKIDDENIYSGAECAVTTPLKVGLITVNEYARASLDPHCNNLYEKSCANYNYFIMLDESNHYPFQTLTAVADNTYEFFMIDYEIYYSKTSSGKQLYPVVYIDEKTIYKSGTGTRLDPYIVR